MGGNHFISSKLQENCSKTHWTSCKTSWSGNSGAEPVIPCAAPYTVSHFLHSSQKKICRKSTNISEKRRYFFVQKNTFWRNKIQLCEFQNIERNCNNKTNAFHKLSVTSEDTEFFIKLFQINGTTLIKLPKIFVFFICEIQCKK